MVCAEDKETVSGLPSAKIKLIQSWRSKTLAFIKRHKMLIFIFLSRGYKGSLASSYAVRTMKELYLIFTLHTNTLYWIGFTIIFLEGASSEGPNALMIDDLVYFFVAIKYQL